MLAPLLPRSSRATAIYSATDCDRLVNLNTSQVILPATDSSSNTPNHSFGLVVENRLYRDVVMPKPPSQVEEITVTNMPGGHLPDPSDSWTIVTHSRKNRRRKEVHGKHFARSSSTRVARTAAPSVYRPSLLPIRDEKSWPKLQANSNKTTSVPASVYSRSKLSPTTTSAHVLSEGGAQGSPKKLRAIPPPLRISPEMRSLPNVVAVSSAWDICASQAPVSPLSWPPRLFQLNNASQTKPHKERGVSLFDPGIIQQAAILPYIPRTWQKYSEYTFDCPISIPSSPSSFSIDSTCDSDEESSTPIPPVEYDGRPDEDAFNHFVAEGTSWVDQAQISESQQVHAVARFLTGPAYDFFARGRRNVPWTLATFFEALFHHIFHSRKQDGSLPDTFQGRDTVTTYVQKVQTLLFVSNIRGERSSRRERVNYLWRGFRREIQESLWNAQYNPDVALWSEIVKYANAFEMAEHITGQDSASWERRPSVRSDETDSEADYPRRLRTTTFRPFDDESTFT